MEIERAEVSLLGHREENQDRCGIIVDEAAMLMIVIDGMGGHSDGALAAQTTLDLISGNFRDTPKPVLDAPGFLHRVIGRAHDRLVHIGKSHSLDARPRATCAVCLAQDGNAFWGHVGDSRIYLIRNDSVFARTRDHSHVEVLIQEGAITEEEAQDHPMRNFVECCIGGDAPVPDMTIAPGKKLEQGDVLLACSDGLWSGLSEDQIAEISIQGDKKLIDNLKSLSMKALNVNSPYSDNTTGTALRWLGP